MGKYIIEGETRSLGNGSALMVALWESNIPKVPGLQEDTFTLGSGRSLAAILIRKVLLLSMVR